jgi:hypothetical protein
MFKPEHCHVAPDGVTIIPDQFDLLRGSALLEAYPGTSLFAVADAGK